MEGLITTEDEIDDLNDKISFMDFINSKSPKDSPSREKTQTGFRIHYHDLLSTKKHDPFTDSKRRPVSGLIQNKISKLERIYGNLPELVVPREEEDNFSQSGSTISIKTGFTKWSNNRGLP